MEDYIPTLISLVIVAVSLLVIAIGFAFLVKNFYRKVNQGKALIINKTGGKTQVSFTGGLVLPVIHRAEEMDISVKTIEIDRRGTEGLICKDNIRADIKVTFFVRVNKTEEDVLKVAQSIGCERASVQVTLEELFSAKFSEALKTVGKRMEFEDLYKERDNFKDQIVEVIGRDLNGYILEDAAIDYLEQTPLSNLDENNILDAQGIRKITELTAAQKIRTNEYANNEKKMIKKQDVEAAEAILALERQQKDAELRQKREIESIQAKEEAETARVRAEEWQRAELVKIKAQEDIAIQNENKQRQIEVAQKNRERVIAIETERVEKDRQLEAIARERETDLMRIAKEKALEEERKAIQDVIRERVVVEKSVAEEEERIKDVRTIAEAKRLKEQAILAAEAEAEEALVKELKEAQAREESAKFKARERLTLAEAELTAADKEAKAKIRMAEALQAEYSAQGIADAKVKEVSAAALEKYGTAEARATLEKMKAEATGSESIGLAKIRVEEAEAKVIERRGQAEARAVELKMTAEAAGLTAKAEAMRALDPASRAHEEFRLKVDLEKTVRLESLNARQEVAKSQAGILGEALKNASVNIVGGDGVFFDRLVNAVSMGKAVDGFLDSSDTAQRLIGDYLGDESPLRDKLKTLASSLSGTDTANPSVSALLAKLIASTPEGDRRDSLRKVLQELEAREGEPSSSAP